MKLTTRCRYGLRALVDLAQQGCSGPVSLARVAARQQISLKYLEQEMNRLRRAGVVRSTQGSSGGYCLADHPKNIRISKVISILEGDLHLVSPPVSGSQQTRMRQFLDQQLWQPLNRELALYFAELTLADLMETDSGREDPESCG